MVVRQTIILFRHGKALKNVQDRHGGQGTDLTDASYQEIEISAKNLSDMNLQVGKILFAPRRHCEQTAQHLGNCMGIPVESADTLVPINLGVIDGLSNNEVSSRYPDIAEQMRKWRSGGLEISQLNIPGMEDKILFYERGKNFIQEIINESTSVIIVATRSSLILLASILLKRTIEVGGNYREIIWGNASYMVFTNSDRGMSFHVDLSSVRI